MNWIVENWKELSLVITTSYAALCAITALTATKKDDAFMAKVGSFLGRFFSIK